MDLQKTLPINQEGRSVHEQQRLEVLHQVRAKKDRLQKKLSKVFFLWLKMRLLFSLIL